MTRFEDDIFKAIQKADGIKGREIAAELGVDKKEVNAMLHSSTALKAVVTQNSDYKWHVIQTTDADGKKNQNKAVPVPDANLQNLCHYYLNCLALESSNSVSQFLTSSYDFKYVVLNGLKIDGDVDAGAMDLLKKISSNRNSKAYFGYPVRLFTFFGKNGTPYRKIAPVFLFSTENSGGRVNISWTPAINMEVIKAYCDKNADSLSAELIQLETDLGMNLPDSEIEIDELVMKLKEIRQWDWKEKIDPYSIPAATDLTDFADGIYNRAILIEAEREIFTAGLESELVNLSEMPEEQYKKTALYSWLKGRSAEGKDDNLKSLLEVLPLNTEQALSVETALNSELTVVTGPPGTGKSQVVTNLLINMEWNRKKALFSSKNNKAVDVVDARVNGLCRRPVLLRVGNNRYASRLAEIIEGLLSVRTTETDKSEIDFYLKAYEDLSREASDFKHKKNEILVSRNQLDALEQKHCLTRKYSDRWFETITTEDQGKIGSAVQRFAVSYRRSRKKNQGFLIRLFWPILGKQRIVEAETRAKEYNSLAKRYELPLATSDLSEADMAGVISAASDFDNALTVALEYKLSLQSLSKLETLEYYDRKLAENKSKMADIAFKLWDKWLTSQAVSLSNAERQEMANFVAAMKLSGDVNLSDNSELKKKYSHLTKRMMEYLQCWAVTSLSAKSRIPFSAGLFDYVIIDEASQCDIASVLPLLYRAKRAVIIGDPKQLRHISQISKKQDLALLQKYQVEPIWSYSTNSLYDLASAKVSGEDIVQLRDHFRSCSDIIDFSNEVFYDGTLRTATKYSGLRVPTGEKPGIRWIDVKGRIIRPQKGSAFNEAEVKAVVTELERLVKSGYSGTMGVTTPFKLQAQKIHYELEKNHQNLYHALIQKHQFIVDTVHKFQGDERDLMLFSAVISAGAPSSTSNFLSHTGNLFNVAITRARAVLVVVGDHHYCLNCEIPYLNKFASYYLASKDSEKNAPEKIELPNGREYPWVPNPEQVSEWEKTFYTALYDAGIRTIPQYKADRYRLDFAVVLPNGHQLDIEVDGEMYHRNWHGELCYRDQLRNQRLFELGWDVKRFWVYQIRDQQSSCIDEIRQWIKENSF